MTRRRFEGEVVIITGGAGGLGLAFADRFGSAGARVALLDIDSVGLDSAAAHLRAKGIEVLASRCDVTDSTEVEAVIDTVTERWGDPAVVVNNAGLTHRSSFRDTELEVFRRVMEVSYFGALVVTKAALEGLIRKQGLIITVSSIAGFSPLYGRTGYAGAKHALHGAFESLRTELAADRVGVLMVAPSFVETDFRFRALDGDGSVTTHPQSRVGGMLSAAQVANRVYRAAERDRRMLVLSPTGKVARVVSSVAPALYEWLMARSLRSELDR